MRTLLTSLLCVFTLSLTAQEACPNPYDGNGDGNVSIGDFLEMLAVFGDTDTDSDGVWDSLDDCVDLAACNYANDPSEPCAYIDVLGVCGGGCEGDGDEDGICDSEDDCVGVLDECGVCNGPGPTEIVIESITFEYDSVFLPLEDDWYVYEISTDTTFSYTCAPYFGDCGDLVSHDGYDYSTVLIGDQCWFSENCRYLPVVSPSSSSSTTAPYYYVYGYEGSTVSEAKSTENYETYGVLYNWPAVMTEGICPSGWHVPSDEEWQTMEISLGMSESEASSSSWRGSPVGDYIKSTSGWNDNNGNSGNGSNSSGFDGRPGGWTFSAGFFNLGDDAYWWSSPASDTSSTWIRELNHSDNVSRDILSSYFGFSARCVIDYTDECGVLNGDNSTCTDNCGVLNGDGSSCAFTSCGDDMSHEGYNYSTVQIGDQCWFAENCRYLPEVSPSNEGNTTDPYYYVYGYEGTDVASAMSTSNYATYGVLYNWPAVMTEGICPSGWHIPSDEEFTQL
ncbi:MAG: FISUMP domain-containing protein, partial [Flavobacteriales bacterium]|nr:FISUMP domain-containing protein [Flavobacteriales bacterium]